MELMSEMLKVENSSISEHASRLDSRSNKQSLPTLIKDLWLLGNWLAVDSV